MLPKLYVDQVRLRPIRLPVGLQVVIPQLIHSKTWTHRGQTHQTRIDPNDLWNWSKLGNCAVRQTAYYAVEMWICIWTPPKRKITQFLRLCPLPKDVYSHLYTQQTVGAEGVVTRFTGREGPHRLGADLPNRPGPLQLLRVSSRWCLARCRHTLKQKTQVQPTLMENLTRFSQKVNGDQ